MNWNLKPLWKIGVVAAVAGLTIVAPRFAQGADHTDSPAATADPAADINDVFAWMTDDAANLNLALTYGGLATIEPSTAVGYAFHLARGNEAPTAWPPATPSASEVRCTFADATTYECWLIDMSDDSVISYVTGDVGDEAGATSEDGMMRVFAGPRNDAFVFDFSAFVGTVDFARDAAPTLPDGSFNAAGCLTVDADTLAAIQGMLLRGEDAEDGLAGVNPQTLVVQIAKDLIPGAAAADENDNIAVWASTNQL